MYNCYLEIERISQETLNLLSPLEVTSLNGMVLVHYCTEQLDLRLVQDGVLYYMGRGKYGLSVRGDICMAWDRVGDVGSAHVRGNFYVYFGVGELETNEG
jgi:hypothetical protein